MKINKVVLVVSVLLGVGFSAWAADPLSDRLWSSLFNPVSGAPGLGGEVNGNGAGWWVEVYNVTDNASTGGNTSASLGWVSGYGYAVNTFSFGPATEGDSVALRLWNNSNPLAATYRIDSATLSLPNLIDANPVNPGDTDVTFNMTGSTWQAVPEPATALLFAIGGFGAWLVRRNKLSSKYGTDA